MINKGKTAAYIRYGLGEIALVVIGILIAIQVNNWNQNRKDNNRVLKIFAEMQKELLSDLQESNALIKWAIQQDEHAAKIIASEIADSVYQDPNHHYLFDVGTETYPLIVTDVAFKKLSEFNGNIPGQYDPLIDKMNLLYIEEKQYVEEVFKRLNDYTLAHYNEMYRKHAWMVDLEEGNITPEILDYFQHNPLYKSHIYRYKNLFYELAQENVRRFQSRAIVLFYEIEARTNLQNIPAFIQPYAPIRDTTELMPYLGLYEKVNAKIRIELTQKRGRLYANNELMYYSSVDTLQYADFPDNYIYFERGENNEVLKSTVKWNDRVYIVQKKEE